MALVYTLDATGLTLPTYDDYLDYYQTMFRAAYGPDINLDSNTPDGQIIGNIIQQNLDRDDLVRSVYNSMDPDNAVGVVLDQRCAQNGIQRQAGTYTITNITLVLTQSVNLYGLDQSAQPVYTVADNAGNQYQLIETQLGVSSGTDVFAFQAVNIGEVLTTPNTITVPVTIILGVQSINNPTAATEVGINEETDAALRVRRAQSVSNVSQGYLAGLLGVLENINGITSAFIYENTTDSTDSDGVPGHSIWVIVAGTPTPALGPAWNELTTYSYGQIVSQSSINYISWQNENLGNDVSDTLYWGVWNPVAQAIYQKRNAGCGMYGDTEYTVTQIDGAGFIVKWDTVETQNLFIAFTASSIDGVNQPDIAGILEGLPTSFVPGVYESVNINSLATAVQAIDSNCLVTSAGFSLALTQIATLSGIAASGTFKFKYGGNETAAINWNDAAATIQTKLRAVSGLSAATVSGSIASQTLTIALVVESADTLLTLTSNSLATGGAVAITFSFNEGYANVLTPSTKKNQFAVAADQIIILPMILSPTTVSVAALGSQTFTGLGGYGTLTYSLQSNVSGGSINSSTGAYTAGSTPGTDVAKVTDAFGNTATATITVT